jgi:endonuclease YncB( thermonuclease family)
MVVLCAAVAATGCLPAGPDPSADPVAVRGVPETGQPTAAPSVTGTDAETAMVSRAIDGDTLELADGRRVRLVGIDTPERDECGWAAAGAELARMVDGAAVQLVSVPNKDTDRYGRLLRYIDVDGRDAGMELIRAGLAIARYDSRDGYGAHPREAAYVQTDISSANVCTPR